ncbi:MAG TPA: hypothetical protein VF056_05250 [Thermoleophilaceae bacterium]
MDRFDNKNALAHDELEQRLRSERPELSAIRLDAVKGNVRGRVHAGGTPLALPGRSFMKSRLALTMILVLGVMMSGTGATIAITGASDDGNAGVAQYGQQKGEEQGGGNLAGQNQGGGDDPQSTEQVAAQGGNGSLPFTGFVAIPLLVGGVALAGTGAVLRRRTRE